MVRLFFIILTLVTGLSLAACAPYTGGALNAAPGSGNETTTGFNNKLGVPYTAGGDTRLIQERKKQEAGLAPAPNEATRILAESIRQIRIVRVNEENKIDRFGRKEVRIEIDFGQAGQLRFSGALKGASGQRVVSETLTPKAGLQVTAEFEDEANQRYSAGKILLTQVDERKRPLAQVGVFLRSYSAAVTTSFSTEQTLNPVNERYVQLLVQRAFAWVSNLVIQNGRSFYEVHLYAASSKDKTDQVDQLAAGRRLFSFAGEAVRTGDFADAPATWMEQGLMNPLKAELIGDAEDEDQRTFSVILNGFREQNIDLALRIEKPHHDVPMPRQKILKGLTAGSYLRVNYNDLANPKIKKMIDDFESNYQVQGMQAWIKRYTSSGARRESLRNALTHADPFRPLVEEIFHNYGVAPPAALVTFIESAFFASGKYKLEVNPRSTATGPFQLLWGSGKAMQMKVYQNRTGKMPVAKDHRLFFVPSACAAARHLKSSLESVAQNDSTLAIAAYYLGNGGVANAIGKALKRDKSASSMQLVKRYNIRYSDVAKQHMLPAHVIDYVNKALSLYFITGNPAGHNFDWVPQVSPDLPHGKILPPDEIQDPTCKASVHNLTAQKLLDL